MIDFSNFYQLIAKSPLSHWLETLPAQVAAWQRDALHGKFREWERAVEFLPELTPWRLDLLHSVTAESETPLSEGHQRRIENLLKNLMPWRKGPYSLYGINIDTEWRSDWKWERVLPHLSDLTGRTILDVGCGSGALTIACAKRNPQGSMLGVDRWGHEYASYNKPLCERNAAAEGTNNVSFARGDALKLDFPDESFDAVTSNYVYHNVTGADKQELLLETLRVLKKGGSFAFVDLFGRSALYGDMEELVQQMKDSGLREVGYVSRAGASFVPALARPVMTAGVGLLYGVK